MVAVAPDKVEGEVVARVNRMTSDYKYPAHEISSLQSKAVKAASQVLERDGVEGLNLKAIATAAGIGVASMYHYFKNKDEILIQVALSGYEDLERDLLGGQPDGQPAREEAGRAFFDFAARRPALFAVMSDESLMARHQSLREAYFRTFRVYEAAVLRDERIPIAHRQNVAYALCVFGRGLAAMMASHPNGALPPDVAARLEAGVRYLLDREG